MRINAKLTAAQQEAIFEILVDTIVSIGRAGKIKGHISNLTTREVNKIAMHIANGKESMAWRELQPHLPARANLDLFTNGNGNVYDSPWWQQTDLKRNAISKRVVNRVQHLLIASVVPAEAPYSQRMLTAGRDTGKAAGAVLFCPATGRCLWVKRSNTGDAPNVWCCLGGGIEQGETIMEGFRRELQEEGGINERFPTTPFHKFTSPDGSFSYYNMVSIVDQEFDPVLNGEHTDFVWSESIPTPAHPELEKALRDPRFRQLIDKYRAKVLTATTKSGYEQALEQKQQLEEAERAAAQALRHFPKKDNGLTPDEVRKMPEYKQAKLRYDRAFAQLRQFNQQFLRKFKKEYMADRNAKRMARVKSA